VEALKQGADDFLTKPLDLDHFRLAVNRALETRALRREVERYRQVLDSEKGFHGILGRSPAVQALIEKIRALAPADGPVLITGESGTGKELVARAIHAEGSRSDGPFIAVNCAGIPPELMESELFGHTAGAFTSANRARKGLIAEAHGGTLLLDEIGEMPMEMQTKLLRILQDGAIRQVGSNQEVHVDVRILAATNRNLDDEVAAGRFREDLFYRLETFALDVPALRERDDDIERMAVHFSQHFAAAQNKAIEGLDPQALARLRGYRFPGNVRELANAMERAVTFCNDRTIRPEHLPERISERAIPETDGGGRSPSPWGDDPEQLPSLATVQHRYIEHVLEVVSGNKRRASQILGIGRRTLYRRLEGEVSEDDDEDVP
jgi:DNA-binding NtrC family response regulator